MTLHPYLLRACYLRTLRRFVGPHLAWQVRNPNNDLHRASSPRAGCKGVAAKNLLPATPTNSDSQSVHAFNVRED